MSYKKVKISMFKWAYGLSGNDYRVVMLSKLLQKSSSKVWNV